MTPQSKPASSLQKSTTVRNKSLSTARFLIQSAQRFSESAAATLAERLFCTPIKGKKLAKEEEALLTAAPLPVVIGGQKLAAYQWGQGPTILLVHGWAGRAAQLGGFVDPLVSAGFRVVAVDVKAHGASSGSQAALSDFTEAVYATAAAAGGVDGILCHSFGAAGVWTALARGLYTRRVVMVSPVGALAPSVSSFGDLLGLTAQTKTLFRQRIEARTGMLLSEYDLPAVAPRLAAPLLVIHDKDDREVSYEKGTQITSLWPNARLETTQGLGHKRILWDPSVIARAVDFFARHDLRSTTPRPTPTEDEQFEALHLW